MISSKISKENKEYELDLSIIVVSFNTKKLTEDCLRSIVDNTKGINFEIIVVDNNSKDGSVEMLKNISLSKPITVITNSTNKGFGLANNQGVKRAKGKYCLLLNSDTLISNNVLAEMVEYCNQNPKIGIASCALANSDGSLQGTGGYFPTLGKVIAWMYFLEDIPFVSKLIKPYHPMHPNSFFYKGKDFFDSKQKRDWLTGAFLLIRQEVFDQIGYFDEDYFMYVEEVDLCYRASKKGWQTWYLPNWQITHFGGASSTSEYPLLSEFRGIKIFYQKHLPHWQMPFLRFFLKTGALLRMIIFGLFSPTKFKIYAKAFKLA